MSDLLMVRHEFDVERDNIRTKVIVTTIGIAAADIQFILQNEIREIKSVGYIDAEDDSFLWKFGKPAESVLEEVEDKLRSLLTGDIVSHFCVKRESNFPLEELKKMCPLCEKPAHCTAWRKYPEIAFPNTVL